MGNSIALALYLATRARKDRIASAAKGVDQEPETDREKERLGYATAEPIAAANMILFHTGADRAGQAARELATRLRAERADLSFVFTTSAKNRLKSVDCLASQYVPDDLLPAIRRFLDHWKPDIAVFTEPDLRPALISELYRRKIPLFLVDANTSRPDPPSWRWRRGMSGSLLARFEMILSASAQTASALKRLGADPEKIETAGPLQEGTPALSCNEAERDQMAARLAARPVWLAAHVTAEECTAVIDAHTIALRRAHRLLLILVPDDPAEGTAWHRALSEGGHSVCLRSSGDEPAADTQIYIADTTDEMGLWFRLAPIAYLGRSTGGGGGVNPYEAAALGSAIIHGPDVQAHLTAYARLSPKGATRPVNTSAELGEAVDRLLSPDIAAQMARNAWAVCTAGAEVTDRARDLIFAELDRL